jgi:hypothetical protein
MDVRSFTVGALLVAAALPMLAPLGLMPALTSAGSSTVREERVAGAEETPQWPTHFRDQPLTPLPLSALEERFARRFPGSIARFTDGENVLILRHVTRPTRQLHPAEDCFKGLGYSVTRPRPFVDQREQTWSCFAAERDGMRVRVCERIHDKQGASWTDVSAWFWATQYGGGPWWTTTVVTPEHAP